MYSNSQFNNLWAGQTKEVCSQRQQKGWQAPMTQTEGRAGAMALRQEGAFCFNELKESMCSGVQRLKKRTAPVGGEKSQSLEVLPEGEGFGLYPMYPWMH